MRRKSEHTRQRIVEAAYAQFYRKGFTRVSVDDIAARAGITKRTLYAYFRSKDELFTAALESADQRALARVKVWAERLSGGPGAMLDQFFAEFERWASTPRWTGAGFTRVAMELADLPGHPAHPVARRHKKVVEARLADLLGHRGIARPRERAREVMLLLEGVNALMLIHRDPAYARAAARAARRLLGHAKSAPRGRGAPDESRPKLNPAVRGRRRRSADGIAALSPR